MLRSSLDDEKQCVIGAVQKHGLRLQYQAGKALSDLGWTVNYERAYRDDSDGSKVRRADIWAERKEGNITAIIVAECKYLTHPAVIFHDRKSIIESEILKSFIIFDQEELTDFLMQSKKHHWFSDAHHQLYISSDKGDVLTEALHQCIKPIVSSDFRYHRSTIFYPMVVFGGSKIFSTAISSLEEEYLNKERLNNGISREMLRLSYRKKDASSPQIFNIDLVHKDMLEQFVAETVNAEFRSFVENENFCKTQRQTNC